MHKILIVDDDADIRDALSTLLIDEGYSVLTAMNGVDALNILSGIEPPALILLDMTMPHMSGEAFLRQLRGKWGDVAVVVLSAIRCAIHDRVAVLEKPFDFDLLMTHVRHNCGIPHRAAYTSGDHVHTEDTAGVAS